MNIVNIIGRLTKDPEVRYTQNQTAVAKFTIAINRGKDQKGNDLGVDYPSITAFGKTAELVEKYVTKGRLIGVTGRIQTGSYEKDGHKYYTTDVIADRVEFLEKKETKEIPEQKMEREIPEDIPSMFSRLDEDDIPF